MIYLETFKDLNSFTRTHKIYPLGNIYMNTCIYGNIFKRAELNYVYIILWVDMRVNIQLYALKLIYLLTKNIFNLKFISIPYN